MAHYIAATLAYLSLVVRCILALTFLLAGAAKAVGNSNAPSAAIDSCHSPLSRSLLGWFQRVKRSSG